MRHVGTPSWQFTEDDGSVLHVALFIRDAARLNVPVSPAIPPPSAGDVPDIEVPQSSDRDVLGAQWAAWWKRLLAHRARETLARWDESGPTDHRSRFEARQSLRRAAMDPPDFASLAGEPELRSLVTAHITPAVAWHDATRRAKHATGADTGTDADADPGTAPGFAWQTVKGAADDVVAARAVPASALVGAVDLCYVTGTWSHLAAPGYLVCSPAAAADPATAPGLVRDTFVSGLDAGPR